MRFVKYTFLGIVLLVIVVAGFGTACDYPEKSFAFFQFGVGALLLLSFVAAFYDRRRFALGLLFGFVLGVVAELFFFSLVQPPIDKNFTLYDLVRLALFWPGLWIRAMAAEDWGWGYANQSTTVLNYLFVGLYYGSFVGILYTFHKSKRPGNPIAVPVPSTDLEAKTNPMLAALPYTSTTSTVEHKRVFPDHTEPSAELAHINEALQTATAQAKSLIESGSFSEAVEFIGKPLESLGESAELSDLRSQAGIGAAFLSKLRSERGVEAMATCRKMLKVFPNNREAQVRLQEIDGGLQELKLSSENLIKAGDFKHAIEEIDAGLEKFGSNTELQKLRGQASKCQARLVELTEVLIPASLQNQHFVAVLRQVDELVELRADVEGVDQVREQATQAVQEARALSEHADQCLAGKRPKEALVEYNNTSQICKDFKPAVEGVKNAEYAILSAAHARKTLITACVFFTLFAVIISAIIGYAKISESRDQQAWEQTRQATIAAGTNEAQIENIYNSYLKKHPGGVGAATAGNVIAQIYQARQDRIAWAQTQELITSANEDEAKVEQAYDNYLSTYPDGIGAATAANAIAQIDQARQERIVWAQTQEKIGAANGDETQIEDLYKTYLSEQPKGIGAATATQALDQIEQTRQERNAWEQTQKEITAANGDESEMGQVYTNYLNEHPNGPGVLTAKEALAKIEQARPDRIAWARTQDAIKVSLGNEIQIEQLYQQYLNEQPNGRGAATATQALDQIEQARQEQNAWVQTQEKITAANGDESQMKQVYATYLSKHPNGPGVPTATEALATIEQRRQDRSAWIQTQEDIRAANGDESQIEQLYKSYLNEYPNGIGASTAAQQIGQDRIAWEQTQDSVKSAGRDVGLISQYLQQYLNQYPSGYGASNAAQVLRILGVQAQSTDVNKQFYNQSTGVSKQVGQEETHSPYEMTTTQRAAVVAVLRLYSTRDLYITPEIPPNKLSTARESCMIAPDHEPLGLVDVTVFGSAKNCLVITTGGIYFRNSPIDPHSPGRQYLSIAEFETAPLGRQSDFDILIAGIHFNTAGCLISRNHLIDLLRDVQRAIRSDTAMLPRP